MFPSLLLHESVFKNEKKFVQRGTKNIQIRVSPVVQLYSVIVPRKLSFEVWVLRGGGTLSLNGKESGVAASKVEPKITVKNNVRCCFRLLMYNFRSKKALVLLLDDVYIDRIFYMLLHVAAIIVLIFLFNTLKVVAPTLEQMIDIEGRDTQASLDSASEAPVAAQYKVQASRVPITAKVPVTVEISSNEDILEALEITQIEVTPSSPKTDYSDEVFVEDISDDEKNVNIFYGDGGDPLLHLYTWILPDCPECPIAYQFLVLVDPPPCAQSGTSASTVDASSAPLLPSFDVATAIEFAPSPSTPYYIEDYNPECVRLSFCGRSFIIFCPGRVIILFQRNLDPIVELAPEEDDEVSPPQAEEPLYSTPTYPANFDGGMMNIMFHPSFQQEKGFPKVKDRCLELMSIKFGASMEALR
ncbi:hypothetical protein Fmac_015453 [Flemingia macrophylla]|uniref:Uncharacterized protein n=1 Tax=Flemingia macrophylla TaxID=520843 RepID=A0ABD1MEL9_9FABA